MTKFVNKLNSNINGVSILDELVLFDGINIVIPFNHNNVKLANPIELWTGVGKTGTKITDYTVTQNAIKPWVYELNFGVSVLPGTYYLNYTSIGDHTDADVINAIQDAIKAIEGTFVSVKDLGAKADGTDDAPVIQSALDASGSIYVPEGVYDLGSSLTLKSNTHLKLHPNAILRRKHNDILMTNYDDFSTGWNGVGNIVIEGGTLDVNGLNYPDVANGISFSHGHDVVIRDLTLKDTPLGHSIELTGTIRALIDNVHFLGYRMDDALANYYVEAIQLEPTLPPPTGATYTYPYVTDSTPTKDVVVRNCYFGASENYPPHPCGVGSHGVKYDIWYDNIKVIGNTFDGCTYWAIRPFKWRSSDISGNTIRNGVASGAGTGAGIYITIPSSGESIKDINGVTQTAQGTEKLIVSNNIIETINGKAIYVQGASTARVSQITITNNTLKDVNGYGIQCEYMDRSLVSGNNLEDITGRALSLLNVINSKYLGNIVHLVTDNCIFATASQFVDFIGNTIDNIKYYGFNISGDNKDLTISENLIKNPSQWTNGGYDGLIISTGADGIRVTNNKVRYESGLGLNAPRYGLNVQSGVTNFTRFGNDFKCGAVTASVSDLSTTPVTTSADIV